jgi:hypothetical protein
VLGILQVAASLDGEGQETSDLKMVSVVHFLSIDTVDYPRTILTSPPRRFDPSERIGLALYDDSDFDGATTSATNSTITGGTIATKSVFPDGFSYSETIPRPRRIFGVVSLMEVGWWTLTPLSTCMEIS